MWETIAADAAAESPLWAEALLAEAEQVREPVFSPLAPAGHALGLETIYEGYLVHYGRSRLFSPADPDSALLLGDYLYAHGLVRVAATGDVAAVARSRRADLALRAGAGRGAKRRRRRVGGHGGVARRGELGTARDALRVRWTRACSRRPLVRRQVTTGRARTCCARPARRIESRR